MAEADERADLVGESREAIEETVGDRRRTESTSTSAGRPTNARALDDHHIASGIVLLGLDRGPEPGEATTNDRQIGMLTTDKWIKSDGSIRIVEPDRGMNRIGDSLPGTSISYR